MKIYFYFLLGMLLATPQVHSEQRQIDDAFFGYLYENYENLDKALIKKSAERHTESTIELSNRMIISGDKQQIMHGEELLIFLAQFDPRALFSLGSLYRKGVEIFPEGEAPQKLLRNYEKSAFVFKKYLESFDDLNHEMSLYAYAFAGEALFNARLYDSAAKHLLGDTERAEKEPTGLAAFSLGSLYLYGDSLEENKLKALYWFDIAANKGLGIAEVERNFLRSEMKDSDLNNKPIESGS